MSFTFELGGQVNTSTIKDTINIKSKITNIIGGDIEQVCDLETPLVAGGYISNLVGLAHLAFASHRPMILDPDSIWLTIEHGLATHIKQNAEELREKFITFKGKKTIEIIRNNFIRGSVNDWEGCFDEFSEKIGDYIGPKKDLIVGKFSTTTPLHRVSSEIVLMDAMSKYFDYLVTTRCYIPIITLSGKTEDWELIRSKVDSFDEFGLSWWTNYLKPVLDEFVNASKGNFNPDFWKSWYKEGGGSGGPFIGGHINALFPYVGSGNRKNEHMGTSRYHGNSLSNFNQSISKTPFIWNYYSKIYPMEFVGGIVGITQEKSGAVKCAFGWAVREESVSLSNFPIENIIKDMVINHKDGRIGHLKRAEAEHWDSNPDDKQLYEVQILWNNGKQETYNKYQFDKLFVKEVASGNRIEL